MSTIYRYSGRPWNVHRVFFNGAIEKNFTKVMKKLTPGFPWYPRTETVKLCKNAIRLFAFKLKGKILYYPVALEKERLDLDGWDFATQFALGEVLSQQCKVDRESFSCVGT